MTEFINAMMEFSDKAYDFMWSVVMICLGIMATRALARWSDTEQLIKELAETYLRHRARMREKYSRTAKSLVVWVVAASAVGVSSVSAANTFPTSSPEMATGPTRPPSFPLEARKTDLSSFPSIRMFAFLSAAQDYESCVEAVHDDPLEPCNWSDAGWAIVNCVSCAAAAAAIVAWKLLGSAAALVKVGKTVATLLKLGAAWAAVEEAGQRVLNRCRGCVNNDCVGQIVGWATRISAYNSCATRNGWGKMIEIPKR